MYLLIVCIVVNSMLLSVSAVSEIASKLTANKRIIGGKIAKPHAYPFIVGLEVGGHHLCGASLICQEWVLTAAHCFSHPIPLQHIKLVFGDHSKDSREVHEIRLQPDHIITHPKYNNKTKDSDLTLLHLPSKLTFSQGVHPIKLAHTAPGLNRHCHIAGWGLSSASLTQTSPALKVVTVPILETTRCKSLERGYHKMNHNMFCAGNLSGGEDSCNGDSGGPLFCEEKAGVYQQYGVVSWGPKKCAKKNGAGVYVCVSKFIDWIEKKTGCKM